MKNSSTHVKETDMSHIESGHALILGASGGIGNASAEAIARSGEVSVMTITYGRSKEKAEQLSKVLCAIGIKKVHLAQLSAPFSDADVPAFEALLDEAVAANGSEISIMVNTIGISPNVDLDEQTIEGKDGWRNVFAMNLETAFLATRSLTNRMKAKGVRGSIVHIASTNGVNSYADYSMHYDLSKTALAKMVQNWCETLARGYGIRINAVNPGWVKTSAEMAPPNPEEVAKETAKIFLGRFAEASEIGEVVAFLAGSKASYITGQAIMVDGGYR